VDGDVMERAGHDGLLIVRENKRDADLALIGQVSVTVTVKVNVPADNGVPVMAPVEGFKLRPEGKVSLL
jgi:copper(I)-binding protein